MSQDPQAPNPYGATAEPQDPGKTLGLVGFIVAFPAAIVGMIISIVALRKSKAAGFKNGLALGGIIVGAVLSLAWIGFIIAMVVLFSGLMAQCADLGPGMHEVNGGMITCS